MSNIIINIKSEKNKNPLINQGVFIRIFWIASSTLFSRKATLAKNATIAEWNLHDPVRNGMVCYLSSESGEQSTRNITFEYQNPIYRYNLVYSGVSNLPILLDKCV
mgnify:CR=1 FL=1